MATEVCYLCKSNPVFIEFNAPVPVKFSDSQEKPYLIMVSAPICETCFSSYESDLHIAKAILEQKLNTADPEGLYRIIPNEITKLMFGETE